jgi:hypothetical protein
LINQFFQRFYPPKKGFFKICSNFSYFYHHCKWIKYTATYAMFLFSKFFGIWIQDSRAAGYMSLMAYVLNSLEDKERRFKTNLILRLILRFNLRLRGYSLWSAIFIAPHIKEDLKTTRGMSTSQPRCSQGSTWKTPPR